MTYPGGVLDAPGSRVMWEQGGFNLIATVRDSEVPWDYPDMEEEVRAEYLREEARGNLANLYIRVEARSEGVTLGWSSCGTVLIFHPQRWQEREENLAHIDELVEEMVIEAIEEAKDKLAALREKHPA
jgi:hypothetical protein